MRFTDFVEQSDLIEEMRAEEIKNQMTAGAFIGWQAGAGGKKGFGEYLRDMGLAEKEPKVDRQVKKAIARHARNRADEIVKRDRRRKIK